MARNRRNSTSMKFAVGQGCFLFLVGALCVGFSVTKIIVGSEYVNTCPSREMIPVYVIVSGCLPVLLSALRQPYDSEQTSEKERWSMKITLFTSVVGVMVNLAWLVAGTYLVVTTWSGDICNIPAPKRSVTTLVPEFSTTPAVNRTVNSKYLDTHGNLIQYSNAFPVKNATVVTERSDKNLERSPDEDEDENNERQNNNNETESKIMENVSLINSTLNKNSALQSELTDHSDVDDANKEPITNEGERKNESDEGSLSELKSDKNIADQIESHDQDFIRDSTVSKAVTKSMDEDVITKSTTYVEKTVNKLITPDMRTNKVESEDGKFTETSSKDKLCITCNIHILRFSLAVVVIDWIFVIFGMIYFCHFVYYKFASIKENILLMSA